MLLWLGQLGQWVTTGFLSVITNSYVSPGGDFLWPGSFWNWAKSSASSHSSVNFTIWQKQGPAEPASPSLFLDYISIFAYGFIPCTGMRLVTSSSLYE